MADAPNLSRDELERQLRCHLESLRLAGVEWVPYAPVRAAVAPADHPVTVPTPSPVVATTPVLPSAAQPLQGIPTMAKQEVQSELSLEQRRKALRLLAKEISTCPRCAELMATRTQTVFADGELGAELCFIGEAPGADEDEQGKPFVGAAGQLLNKIITGCGLKREEIYICNILKCHPPGNRTPLATEAANCREFLDKQLALVAPKFICCLGGCAAQNLLGTTLALGKLRGKFHDYKGIPVLCTYHPAYLLPHRAPEKKKDVWEDMKLLLTRMGRPIPTTKQS